MSHGQLESFRIAVVARFAVADVCASDERRQRRRVPLRHEEREAAPGDDRLPQRRAADVRSGRQVPVLRVRSRVRSGLRQLRQQLDLSEPDEARRGAAAEGRQVAARGAQRRRERPARRRQAGRQARREAAEPPSRKTRRQARRSRRRRSPRRRRPKRVRLRRPMSTSTSTASKPARSCCRPRAATTPTSRPSRASCSTGGSRARARATRRARSRTSISPSAKRRPCWTTCPGSR